MCHSPSLTCGITEVQTISEDGVSKLKPNNFPSVRLMEVHNYSCRRNYIK